MPNQLAHSDSNGFFEDGRVAGRHFQESAPDYPDVIQIEITSACNLRCIMCPIQLENRERSAHERVIGLDRLESMRGLFEHAYEVELTGFGEIFCHPRLIEVLRFFRRCGLNVHATSNGMLMDEARAHTIVEEGLVDLLAFSLDAATKATHDAIRPGGDFEEIIKNIGRLDGLKREHGKGLPIVHFNFLAMERNIFELGDFVRLAERLGAGQVIVQGLCEAEETAGLAARGRGMREAYAEAARIAAGLGIAIEFWYMPDEAAGISGPAVRKVQVVTPRPGPSVLDCLYPWDRVFIKSNLDVQICATLWEEMVMGNLRDQSFERIWRGEAYRRARDQMRGTSPPGPCARGCTSKARRPALRVDELSDSIDMGRLEGSQLGLGFYPREMGDDGIGRRWAKRRAAFFLRNTGRPFLDIDLAAHPKAPEMNGGVWINGTRAGSFMTRGIWRSPMRFIVPPIDDEILQVDLRFEQSTKVVEFDPAAASSGEAHRPITALVRAAGLAGKLEEIGDSIDFGGGAALDFGWYEPERISDKTGRWSTWRGSFALRNSGERFLTFELLTPGDRASRTVSVSLDGEVVDMFQITGPAVVRRTVRLPSRSGPYLIFEVLTEPPMIPPEPDTRRLGVFMVSARLGRPSLLRRTARRLKGAGG